MKLRRKVQITLIVLILLLVLMISVSYAWYALSVNPEVTSVETNVGANGSLEIALLNDRTFADPVSIRAHIGDSAVEQDALQSNQSWGNVIELADERYGLGEISLLPARLNLFADESGRYCVNRNMLQVAEFGIDGRITILSTETVSAIMEENKFTYYTDAQRYGVRAIGTISNLTSQQIALATARTTLKSHTASAARTAKHTWRDYGPGIMDILYSRHYEGSNSFTEENVTSVRNMATGMLEALNYVDAAFRQGIIGIAASNIADEAEFEALCEVVNDANTPLSVIAETVGETLTEGNFKDWLNDVDKRKMGLQTALSLCDMYAGGTGWEQMEIMLMPLLNAESAYIGDLHLNNPQAYENMAVDTVITVPPGCGAIDRIAYYVGNYSAFTMWTDKISVEVRTVRPDTTPPLLRIEEILEDSKAATGGWTRSNIDDTYGFAVDLAFRCNQPSDLLLQTAAALRVTENSEYPVTQGGGSYMRFTSENMDTEQLLKLMDTIRIGFLNDRREMLAIAKLNVSNFEEQEEGIYAPLYLYDFTVDSAGIISMGERRKDDASILALPQNSPAIVTVVVWLDGDSVDNSLVDATSHQSMSGVLNLQFSSSADLRPMDGTMKPRK